MKQTVNFSAFQDAFERCRPNNFTYSGLQALFEYLEQYEQDCGEEIELDVIAICCDFSQYDAAAEAYSQLCNDALEGDDEEEREENAKEWLRDNGTLIECDDGSVICCGQ